MSKYSNFEEFMQAVINEADNKCQLRYDHSLAEVYKVNITTVATILKIIGKGWWVLVALVAILILGPLGFSVAVVAFVTTPAGLIIVGLLAVGGGVAAIKTIYKNRVLPIAVKETGDIYKSDFENHINQYSYIDSLINQASETLISKATNL